MSDPTKVVELPPTHIKDIYPKHSLFVGFPTGINSPGELVAFVAPQITRARSVIETRYKKQLKKLPASLKKKLTTKNKKAKKQATIDSIDQELDSLKTLKNEKKKSLDDAIQKSLSFDGTDPLDAPDKDYAKIVGNQKTFDKNFQTWEIAYQAAFDAKLHEQTIALINKQITQLEIERKEIAERPHPPSTFTLTKASTAFPLVIASSPEAMALFDAGKAALQAAIRASVPALLPAVESALGVATLMVYSPSLGDGERLGVSVPLAELKPSTDQLQELRSKSGKTIPLKVRITSGTLGENSHIYMVPTDIREVPGEVRVRTASWDKAQEGYRFTSEGPGPITLLWTPSVKPGNSSTVLPGETNPKPPFPGLISVPSTPQILSFPDVGDFTFDDYIVTFPADSGLEPVYVMFKSPRDYPGVASGDGQVVSGRWLEAASGEAGAAIPKQVADQLRGRAFATFGNMREAFWTAIANDPELSKSFNNSNISKMKSGEAPWPISREQVGGRRTFELHHILPISQGGAVYDLNNLTVMTPKRHINIHSNRGS